MGLLTTTFGWFPKPVALRRARWQHAEGEIDEAALRAVEQEATAAVMRAQEEAGLDLLVDGQMDRGDMVSHFMERLEGAEQGGLVRCFGNRYYRRPRIVGDLLRTGPVTVDAWKSADGRVDGTVKAILTGPYTLMHWSFDEHYPNREKCCEALAEAVGAEAEDLVSAGATEIEIAEPAIGSRPEEIDLATEAVRRVAGRIHGRARTWIHVAHGNLASVIGPILSMPVDGIELQLSDADAGMLDAIEGLPREKVLAAGVIDVLDPTVEEASTVRARAEAVLEKIGADRLWLAPDAGMHALDEGAVRGKLASLVQAAKTLA
jgi:5-methyltetrahydropteroyltriglutamate--homocysteine methyltransferase